MWRVSIFFEVLWASFLSTIILSKKRINRVQFDKTDTSLSISKKRTEQIIRWVDLILKVIILTKKSNCFYRTYIRFKILRKRHIPVTLNIGLRNLKSSMITRGHCWLTLDDALFHESKPTHEHLLPDALYPYMMGSSNCITYWTNGMDSEQLSRLKIANA
jgi:hypothetical protein